MALVSASHERLDSWIYRNRERLKTGMRILFGAVWGIDGVLKFGSGVPDSFSSMVQSAGNGQPAWLQGWSSFWAGQAAQNPTFWVYLTGVLEIALAAALLLGFARKVAYGGGMLLSLFIVGGPRRIRWPLRSQFHRHRDGIVYAFV
ncbi:copper-containing nitrite reductase, partial [mine drainage metagenome]